MPRPKAKPKEMVNHPAHYNAGSLEVIDAIDGLNLGFYEGTITRYLCRYKHKGTPIQDLKKARWYLDRLITNLEDEGKKS